MKNLKISTLITIMVGILFMGCSDNGINLVSIKSCEKQGGIVFLNKYGRMISCQKFINGESGGV